MHTSERSETAVGYTSSTVHEAGIFFNAKLCIQLLHFWDTMYMEKLSDIAFH
jgi:hypothetical protein